MKDDFANLQRYASENKKLLSNPNDGKRIVFFGDSITEFWTPKNSNMFQLKKHINRGISGQTTSQMVLRFQLDVIQLAPTTVVILAGINDIAENTGCISLEKILENLISMIELALDNNIKVILCSVLPANTFSWNPKLLPADKVIQLNKMIYTYAKSHKISYVDYYSAMVDDNKGLLKKYGEDGVHPNFDGYKKMEELLQPFLKSF
jgi:lysophospholipase L1-like esterase